MSETLNSKFVSIEAKFAGTVMKVVHEEIDSVKRITILALMAFQVNESKLMKFVEAHVDQRV